MTVAATARLAVRVRPDSKARLERAADLVHVPVSDFVRSAAEDRAEQILREHDTQTTVPAEFFDDLLAALDATTQPNDALARAATRARSHLTRRLVAFRSEPLDPAHHALSALDSGEPSGGCLAAGARRRR